jgi:hypothetical protein
MTTPDRLEAKAATIEQSGTRRGTRQAWHLRRLAESHRRKAERAEVQT